MFVGAPEGGRLVELVGNQYPSSEALTRSKGGRETREKRCVGRGATARGAMEKSRYVKVI